MNIHIFIEKYEYGYIYTYMYPYIHLRGLTIAQNASTDEDNLVI